MFRLKREGMIEWAPFWGSPKLLYFSSWCCNLLSSWREERRSPWRIVFFKLYLRVQLELRSSICLTFQDERLLGFTLVTSILILKVLKNNFNLLLFNRILLDFTWCHTLDVLPLTRNKNVNVKRRIPIQKLDLRINLPKRLGKFANKRIID